LLVAELRSLGRFRVLPAFGLIAALAGILILRPYLALLGVREASLFGTSLALLPWGGRSP